MGVLEQSLPPKVVKSNLWFEVIRKPIKTSSYQRNKKLNRYIGVKLRQAREAANLTVAGFAKKLGVTEDIVADIEAGILEIAPIDLLDLAALLDHELAYFFDGYED